jgi:hypothetical protein
VTVRVSDFDGQAPELLLYRRVGSHLREYRNDREAMACYRAVRQTLLFFVEDPHRISKCLLVHDLGCDGMCRAGHAVTFPCLTRQLAEEALTLLIPKPD